MGVLDRRKKQGIQGFKAFVYNIETSTLAMQRHILRTSALDDAVYTQYAFMNVLTFKKFLEMDEATINVLMDYLMNSYAILAQAINKQPEADTLIKSLLNPIHLRNYMEEVRYLPEITERVQQAAKITIVKKIRQLQEDNRIESCKWMLPDPSLMEFKKPPNSSGLWETKYEDGKTSAKGELVGYERHGTWEHFFRNGSMMAKGGYLKDKKEGPWEFYNNEGQVLAKGNYNADEKVGDWEVYDPVIGEFRKDAA